VGFEPAWLRIAWQELGVKGAPETSVNLRIVEYLETTPLGRPGNENNATPWCCGFVNWVIKQAGIESRTNSAWARSWLNWGVAADEPIPGTIAVFSRKANAGHVGFYLAEDATRIQVLGGQPGQRRNHRLVPQGQLIGVSGATRLDGANEKVLFMVIRDLSSIATTVVGYYFGSSEGSSKKNNILLGIKEK